MKRTTIATLLSVLTVIGGHFYNRRWDKAVLFLGVLLAWIFVVYVGLTVGINRSSGAEEFGVTWSPFIFFGNTLFLGLFIIWFSSILVTFFDSRSREDLTIQRWTISGTVGAVMLSLLTSIVLVLAGGFGAISFWSSAPESTPQGPTSQTSSRSWRDNHFSEYVHLGGGDLEGMRNFVQPATGAGYLAGKFVYEGEPAIGVELKLVLNSKYHTDKLITNEQGFFTLRVPTGTWNINMIETRRWANKPKGTEFLVVSGTEGKLEGTSFHRHPWLNNSDGWQVEVTDKKPDNPLTLTIRPNIKLLWPEKSVEKAAATVAESVIEWESYPGATDFLVKISELTREGRSTSYREVATERVTGVTRLSLSEFDTIGGNQEKQEYLVVVYAFAEDRAFLSESEQYFEAGTFTLIDGNTFVSKDIRSAFSASLTADKMSEIRNNRSRLDAVEMLIKENMLDEAEELLGKVKGSTEPGKKEAVTGFLMARKGNCDAAKALFEKARSQVCEPCIPEYYSEGCGQ